MRGFGRHEGSNGEGGRNVETKRSAIRAESFLLGVAIPAPRSTGFCVSLRPPFLEAFAVGAWRTVGMATAWVRKPFADFEKGGGWERDRSATGGWNGDQKSRRRCSKRDARNGRRRASRYPIHRRQTRRDRILFNRKACHRSQSPLASKPIRVTPPHCPKRPSPSHPRRYPIHPIPNSIPSIPTLSIPTLSIPTSSSAPPRLRVHFITNRHNRVQTK